MDGIVSMTGTGTVTYKRHEKCNLDNTKERLKMINSSRRKRLEPRTCRRRMPMRSMRRINPKRRVTEAARTILDENMVQMMRGMLSTDAFKWRPARLPLHRGRSIS